MHNYYDPTSTCNQENDDWTADAPLAKSYILHTFYPRPSLSKSLLNVSILLIDSRIPAYLHFFRSISPDLFALIFKRMSLVLSTLSSIPVTFSPTSLYFFRRETFSLERDDVYSHADEPSSRAVAIH